jgi:RNA polymerase sigma-70 factor (ECF subfamily)
MAIPDIRREFVSLLPRLRRFALVLTGSVDQADDLVQGTLLRALDRIDQCRDSGHLDRWLFSIQKTVWLNTLRAAALRRTEPLEDYDELAASDGVRSLEASVTLSEVRAAFERLSPDHRQVLFLVCVEGYSYSAAAEFLGIPVGTVMSRLARGRAALMAMMSIAEGGNVRPFRARSPDANAR